MQPQTPSASPKIIKRYSNRKLYDTERSCYVTLEEIALMVKEGVEVKIIDNKTKEDLTSVTLTQIIFAEEKKQKSILPLGTLREIIRTGGESLTEFLQGNARRIENLFVRRGEDGAPADVEGDKMPVEGAADEPDVDLPETKGPVRDWFESQRAAFEANLDEWQRRIDQNMKDSLGPLTVLPKLHVELERLTARLDALEDRIAALEDRR